MRTGVRWIGKATWIHFIEQKLSALRRFTWAQMGGFIGEQGRLAFQNGVLP
jgi:hypothetical protein